jgi:hypothetical protein
MNWSTLSPWRWAHGKKAPLRRRPSTAQLAVEALESREMPSATVATTFHVKPLTVGSSPSGYTPVQILEAYNFYSTSGTNNISFNGALGNGAGQTIAIVDAYNDPNIASDLAAFDAEFHLAAPPSFSVLNEKGQTTSLPAVDPSGGWEMEEALDVEWAHAIAPGASIVLVEANGPNDVDLDTAVTTAARLPGVSVISMSWAGTESSGETSQDSIFTTPSGHQGVTFVAASGDSGSPSGYPAYSPNVVSVGGTSLYLNGNNSYQSESTWSGSGGGISAYEAEPSYQLSVQSTGKRTVPDVAFDADPNTGVAIYDSYDNPSGPWTQVGGTSMAAPSWAGILAIVNQGRVAEGGTTLIGATQTLPALYSLPSSDFHDITTGSNGTYSAKAGYDMVTGLGTPIASSLIPDMVSYGNTSAAHLVITATPPNSAVGASFGFTATVEIGGAIDTAFDGNVTVSLLNNPGGSTLSGPLTVTAVNGVATFSGLSLNKAGTGYTLSVSASGVSGGTTSPFNISQAVLAPVPPPIANQTVSAGGTLNLTLAGSDPNGLPLTYSASVAGSAASQAYRLDQQLGLKYMGSYYTNIWGQDERWMGSASGAWYCILPNGQLRRWAGSMTATLLPANLVATLDPSYYANPSLLWNAKPAVSLSTSVKGNQLTIQAPANATGSFQVTVTVSNGSLSASQTFTVSITAPPQLAPITNQTMTAGGSLAVALNGSAGLTYSASVVNASASQAYQLDQQLKLRYMGSYFTNIWGQNEKWMSSASGAWYCILPNGQLRRWAGSMTATLQAANLIATLSASDYADPGLLWNAQAASTMTVSVQGNQLTIQAPAGVVGTFQIQVVASVGGQSVTQTFTVTVAASKAAS